MVNKNLPLKASVLLTILIISIAATPSLISGQVLPATPQKATNISLSEGLSTRLLEQFGYKSPTPVQSTESSVSGAIVGVGVYSVVENGKGVTVHSESNLKIENGAALGYAYNAQFTSSNGKSYSVLESYSKTNNGNSITTTSSENINGSMNFHSYAIEQKTVGAIVNKETDGSLQLSNSSGSYSANFHISGTWTSNESNIISATMVMDQNIVGPIGHYVAKFSPATNGLGTKADITMPNGTVIDPGLDQFANDWNYGYNNLQGWYIWWEPGYEWAVGGILLVLGIIVTALAPEVGWIIDAMDGLTWVGEAYQTDMNGLFIMYFEVVLYLGFIGYYGEAGYYTDQIMSIPYPEPLGDWYYIPLVVGNSWHTDPWPPIGYW